MIKKISNEKFGPYIRRLRKAINIENCKEIIRTVRSTGYALD